MAVHSSEGGELRDAKRRLLAEGAKLYAAGLSAVKEFQREVQARYRQVLEPRLSDHARALGVDVESVTLADTDWVEASGTAGLGVKIKSPEMAYYLLFEDGNDGEPRVTVNIGIWLQVKTAAALEKAFRQVADNDVVRDGHYVYLTKQVHADKVADFEGDLEELVSRWLKLWEHVGGLKSLSNLTNPAAE